MERAVRLRTERICLQHADSKRKKNVALALPELGLILAKSVETLLSSRISAEQKTS